MGHIAQFRAGTEPSSVTLYKLATTTNKCTAHKGRLNQRHMPKAG